ncbi:MAG: hypothetical protein R2793_04240 [Flavobacteriaceae bacterium]
MKKLCYFVCLFWMGITFSQSFNNQVMIDSVPHLLGKFNKDALLQEPYASWFQKNFDVYAPNQTVINSLKKELSNYTITLFMGTWCGDSKRETPRFFKILEAADFPLERVTAVALGLKNKSYKKSPGGEEEGLNIHRVPTFILYKKGVEVNRIVEHPMASLEEDLLQIVTGNYNNYHYGVTRVNTYLENQKPQKVVANAKKISKEILPYIHTKYDLNTFCKVLLAQDKNEEAIAVATINTYLFPGEISVFETLANIQGVSNHKRDAIITYQKALQIDPTREDLQSLVKMFEEELNIKK